MKTLLHYVYEIETIRKDNDLNSYEVLALHLAAIFELNNLTYSSIKTLILKKNDPR